MGPSGVWQPVQTLAPACRNVYQIIQHLDQAMCDPTTNVSRKGFDRAFRNPGAAPCQGFDVEGVCCLISCNVVHNVLVDS